MLYKWGSDPKGKNFSAYLYIGVIFCLVITNVFYPLSKSNHAQAASAAWNLNTSSEYTYDAATLEFSDGNVQLKAQYIPGSNWVANDAGGNRWNYRKKITLDNRTSYLGATSQGLTDFPVSVKLSSANIDYAKTQDLGQDIRFTDTDGSTALSYEIEKWDEAATSYVWVKVPQIDINSNADFIYIYYGNTSVSDGQSRNNVWTANYSMVQHMAETSGTNLDDATSNNKDMTKPNSAEPAAFAQGKLNGAQSFDGTNDLTSSTLAISSATNTISMWVYINSSSSSSHGQGIFYSYPTWNPHLVLLEKSGQLQTYNYNRVSTADIGGGTNYSTIGSISTGQWAYVVLVHSGGQETAYVNSTANAPVVYSTTGGSDGQFRMSWSYWGNGATQNYFNGKIDEVRYATTARSAGWIAAEYKNQNEDAFTTFSAANTYFPTDNPSLTINTGQGFSGVSTFVETLGQSSAGNIKYQVSADNGSSWYWWNGVSWALTIAGYSESLTGADVNTHFADASFNIVGQTPKIFKWKAYFNSDGSQLPKLDNISISYLWDTKAPDNPESLSQSSSQKTGGSAIASNSYYNYIAPYFVWNEPTDYANEGEQVIGVEGYYIYFGTDPTADPHSARGLATELGGTGFHYQTKRNFEVGVDSAGMSSGSTYYLRIETKDGAGNIKELAPSAPSIFTYKFDASDPTSPLYVSSSPSGYSRVNSFSFSWPISGPSQALDTGGSGLVGYQYKINSGAWSGTTADDHVTIADQAVTGVNIFYLRSVDAVGNFDATPVQTNFYFNNAAPTAPTVLTVDPVSSGNNAFTFSWGEPLTYNGSISGYYYSVNVLPTITNVTYTTSTSLPLGAYATQQGDNTLYVVAKDEAGNFDLASCSAISGNPATDSCARVVFSAITSAPGIPTGVQAFDISNRDAQQYATTLKWVEPSQKGTGFSGYEIYRSTDGNTYNSIGTTSGTTYADTDLESIQYYYYIKSKDNANQYSTASSVIEIIPTGRYTQPPILTENPTSMPKAFSANIIWETDREGSSFVYFAISEAGIDQTTGVGQPEKSKKHTVNVTGLQPETTYYYKTMWEDSDGNQGRSQIYSFTTGLRPKISNVKFDNITLSSATITWLSTTISSSNVLFGKTTNYGGNISEQSGSQTTNHAVAISDLDDSTTYHVQITAQDIDGNALSSDDYTFDTLSKPKISNLKFEQIKDASTTTLRFSWKTNVPTSTLLTYNPQSGQGKTEMKADLTTDHEVIIADLADQTNYTIIAKGTDQFGNAVQSDPNTFTTPLDTRPPKITDIITETSNVGLNNQDKAQIAVSWKTDEPATSYVEYEEGLSGTSYKQKTSEDATMTNSHLVIISDLNPSRPYHLRVGSADKGSNRVLSEDISIIAGDVPKSVFNIIVNTFDNLFGWIGKLVM